MLCVSLTKILTISDESSHACKRCYQSLAFNGFKQLYETNLSKLHYEDLWISTKNTC